MSLPLLFCLIIGILALAMGIGMSGHADPPRRPSVSRSIRRPSTPQPPQPPLAGRLGLHNPTPTT